MLKITCAREALYDALQVVSRGVSGRSTRPVQNNVYLEGQAGTLRMIATDLEFISLEAVMPAEVQEEGAITVPARIFAEVAANLPEEDVVLEADERHTISVRAAKAHYSIRGLPAEDFETLPELVEPVRFDFPESELRSVIEQTVFAASTDETRPNLTGVLFQMSAENLEIVATDTYRLAIRKVPLQLALEEPRSVIVSGRALHELVRVLGAESDDPVAVAVSDTQIEFKAGSYTVGSRLIEGQFPSYEKVIPESWDRRLTLDPNAFQDALRRALIVAREDANRIILRTEDDVLRITADSQDVGQAEEEIPVQLEGEPVEIAFNARYMLDALMVVGSERVDLELTGALNPGTLRPSGRDDYLYVLMPMQIL